MSIFGINLQPLKWKQFWKALKQKAAHIGASFRCLGLQLSVGSYGFPLFACWVQHLFSASSSRISYQSHDDLKEDTLWLLYSVCESSVTVGTQSSSQETWVPGPVSVSHLLSDLGEITFFLWNAVLSCYKTRPFQRRPTGLSVTVEMSVSTPSSRIAVRHMCCEALEMMQVYLCTKLHIVILFNLG